MALTFIDIIKRTDSDATIGLIEENLTYAPELQTLPIRTISGTSYRATIRDDVPRGGFRAANEGVVLTSRLCPRILKRKLFKILEIW